MRAVQKVEQIREDLGNVGPVIAAQVEEAMLGRRRQLDTLHAEDKTASVRKMLKFERDLRKQIEEHYQQLQDTQQELELSPQNIQEAVAVALALAGQPPLIATDEQGVFEMPALRGSRANCSEGLEHPHTLEVRPVTFDHQIAQGRDDVVLAHLNHRLVQMALRLLRAEVWSLEDRKGLYRVTARCVPNHALDTVAVVAHTRLVVIGGDSHRLHEEIITAGGTLRENRFQRMNVGQTEAALDAMFDTPANERIQQDITRLWPNIEENLRLALEARMRDYLNRMERLLQEREDGEPKRVWKRIPVEAKLGPLPIHAGKIGPLFPDPNNHDVYVRGLCRRRDDAWTITLFLVNAQLEPDKLRDEKWLFQPELSVRAPDWSPIFIKRQIPPELATRDPEDRAMEMLYRRDVEFAVGHGVATEVELAPGMWNRAVEIRTSVIPFHDVERMDPPTADEVPLLDDVAVDMQVLAETDNGQFGATLGALAEAYANWIDEQTAHLGHPSPNLAAYGIGAEVALENCREALDRIWAGIEVLDTDEQAAEAFRFANRAMALQRVRSIYATEVRQGKEPDLAEIDVPKNRSWRPFQLAFVLLNLPALADPTHPDRSHPTQAIADLLWFPTGGGKTEAYLGVAAFTMGIRRLQGDLGGLSGEAGVTVLMRYTLRLLTLQQLQRATALICACEIIRREDTAKWGAEPFRIGLWVGQRSTPNWTHSQPKS